VRLDASADALAYVHAHTRRLESPALAQILDALAPQRVPTITALRARVDRVLDRLLFGPITLDPARVEARVRTNVVLDALLRAAITQPSLDARALVARARRLVARGPSLSALARFVDDVRAALTQTLSSRRAREAVTLGLVSLPELGSIDTRALARGLAEVVPCTARALGPRGREAIVASLVEQSRRGHLALRVREAIGALARSEGADPEVVLALSELARLEHLLDAPAVHEPRDAWRIPLHEAGDDALVSLRRGVRLERFEHDVIALHRGEAPAPRTVHVAIGHVGDDVILCELPQTVALALARAPSGTLARVTRALGRTTVEDLEAIGVLLVLSSA
jgi:DNA-binding phage protein